MEKFSDLFYFRPSDLITFLTYVIMDNFCPCFNDNLKRCFLIIYVHYSSTYLNHIQFIWFNNYYATIFLVCFLYLCECKDPLDRQIWPHKSQEYPACSTWLSSTCSTTRDFRGLVNGQDLHCHVLLSCLNILSQIIGFSRFINSKQRISTLIIFKIIDLI